MPGLRPLPALSVLLALAMLYYWYSTTRVERPATSPAPAVQVSPPATGIEPVQEYGESDNIVIPARDDTGTEQITAIPDAGDARLSGWVRDQTGAAVEKVIIELHNQGFDGEEPETRRTRSDARGEFSFDDLVAGRSYRLEVVPGAEYAGFSLDSIVASADGSFEEITLEPIRLLDVDGMIVDTSLAPIPNFTFRLRSLVVDFPERVITSDSSGYFRLEGFPEGELRIATSNRDYYRIKGLELKADEYHTLTLMVDKGNYYLAGWVSNEFGTPLDGVRVTIKSAFADREYHSFSYRSTLTDSNGAFEFAELGGNRYTLGVYANGYASHIQNLEFESFSDALEIRLTRAEE